MNIVESKIQLRNEIRSRIKALTPDQRAALSGRACALLQRQTIWEKTPLIFFYAPLPDEVNVWPLIGEGKVKTFVHEQIPFEEAPRAHALMESGSHSGKILLSVDAG